MNKLFSLILLVYFSTYPFIANSQILGGYTIYDSLVTAVHPYGCDPSFVSGLPDDSIWVNFNANDSMTGSFSMPSINQPGADLLLETGFHPSNYVVSLLLSNGQYSSVYNATLSSWSAVPIIDWKYISLSCAVDSLMTNHYILPLDYNIDFGLTVSDTVTGIKIVFLTSTGAPDFAGAYIVSQQAVGMDENQLKKPNIFPNPFSDKLNITTKSNEFMEINLYDVTSRQILHQSFTNSVSINTDQFIKGIYFYELINNNIVVKKGKIIKF